MNFTQGPGLTVNLYSTLSCNSGKKSRTANCSTQKVLVPHSTHFYTVTFWVHITTHNILIFRDKLHLGVWLLGSDPLCADLRGAGGAQGHCPPPGSGVRNSVLWNILYIQGVPWGSYRHSKHGGVFLEHPVDEVVQKYKYLRRRWGSTKDLQREGD